MDKKVKKLLVKTSIFVIIDSLFFYGALSIYLIFWMFFTELPRTLFTKDAQLKIYRNLRFGVLLLAIIAIWSYGYVNIKIADQRFKLVVKAVTDYETKYHKYPDRLKDIAPEFIPSVPLAQYRLMMPGFQYLHSIKDTRPPILYYMWFPPFGRTFYSFKDKEFYND